MKIQIEKPSQKRLDELGVQEWPTWEAPESTFPWSYESTEVCYFIEGKVVVKTEEENVEMGKGDLVTFPRGLKCEWKIEEKVRKYYKFQ